jgi:hypothetical protein
VEQVRWPLWSYRDRKSAPALPAPSGAWQSHLDSLLAVPWRPEKVWQASGMAALHCAGENELTDLLAHAVHLSVPPHLEETDWSEITQYLRRLQHTVAWIAAQVQKESSWQSSLRREALRSLILGPQDWTTCAGITAACQLAITDAACAAELHQMLGSLWDQRPQGRWEWEDVLLDLWPAVPGVRTQTLERIQKAAAEKAAFE